jgi:actin-related protein 2
MKKKKFTSSLPPVIIIDNGSGYIKAGLSYDKEPRVTIPNIIGRQLLRHGEQISSSSQNQLKQLMIGDEVLPFRSLLELSHPMTEGIIQSTDDLELLWEYTLSKKLNIDDYKDRKIIITEAPLNPFENKHKIVELLFEKFRFEFANIEPQAKLSLFCEGIDTGLVLDSGDGVTHCIPISRGVILHNFIERLNIAGRHITEYLIRLLQKKGYSFNSSADFETIREIKEKFCFVSNDIKKDRELEKTTSFYNTYYTLPDGKGIIHLSNEKFEAPEILFDPSLISKDVDGIPEMIYKSIKNCPIDTRIGLYRTMLLSGATTQFPGFTTRLENESKRVYKAHALRDAEDKTIKMRINVIDSPRRKYSVFIGGTIIANYYNTPDSDDYWISRKEWNECENKEELIKNKCKSYFSDKIIKKK